MRKVLLAFLLVLAAAMPLSAGPIGIGGFGGANIPVVQEDQSAGTAFGLHGKIKLIPALVIEGNLTFSKYGETSIEIGSINNTIEGSKVNSYGIDLLLGGGLGGVPGFKPYGVFGAGFYKTSRDFDEDATKIGWSAGFGFEINPVSKLGLDFRGKVIVISSDGGGSKKSALVTGGLYYYLGY
jgi:hypothetical protein